MSDAPTADGDGEPSSGPARTPARSWRRRRPPFVLADVEVKAGRSAIGEVPIPRLVTGTPVSLPLRVVHGRHDGPTVLVSSAIHGDELGGVEIVRRVTEALAPADLHGTVILVPIVNIHGFLTGDRYLPDRRDLNRSFPGSATGSLASRIAHVFMDQLVTRCDVGIDLHTGSDHRTNLPQVRAELDDPVTHDLATAFGAPVLLQAKLRDGSLRAAGLAAGVTMLLYEGGEALRFDEPAIVAGVDGIRRVAHHLGMTPDAEPPPLPLDEEGRPRIPIVSRRSAWVRARRSGVTSMATDLGDRVAKGDLLALVHDSLGHRLSRARAPFDGVVIGRRQHPLVHQGDAIVHVARIELPMAPDPPDARAAAANATAAVPAATTDLSGTATSPTPPDPSPSTTTDQIQDPR